MEKISNYIIRQKIHETRKSIVYRGNKEHDANTVIIKVLKARHPTPSELARFRQEYNLVKNLAIDGIIKTYDLVEHDNSLAIIEDDFDGISLKEIIQTQKTDVQSFLLI